MKLSTKTRALPLAMALAGSLALAACGASNESDSGSGGSDAGGSAEQLSGTLNGAGSSAQQAAMQGWTAGFSKEQPDVTVNYDPVGSGGGREQFLSGGVDFAGSDSALSDDELNLAPATLAGIFSGTITTWNDPAIAADNPGAQLPSTAITPVHRGDKSGTTKNFTDYLSKAAESSWTAGAVDEWPTQGGEAANGTSGVISAVQAGEGAIGYADESQAGDLGIAKIKVGSDFVAPSAEGAAAVVEGSQLISGRGDYDFAYEINRTTTNPDEYPVVLVSYHIGCTQVDDATQADLLKAFESYVISEDGQKAAADQAGSSPISDALREQATKAVDAITAA